MTLAMDVEGSNVLIGSGTDILGAFTIDGIVTQNHIEFTKQYTWIINSEGVICEVDTSTGENMLKYEGLSDNGVG